MAIQAACKTNNPRIARKNVLLPSMAMKRRGKEVFIFVIKSRWTYYSLKL